MWFNIIIKIFHFCSFHNGKGVKYMENNLIQKLISAVGSELSSDNDEDIIITEKEMENTYKKIIDKLAHNIFFRGCR